MMGATIAKTTAQATMARAGLRMSYPSCGLSIRRQSIELSAKYWFTVDRLRTSTQAWVPLGARGCPLTFLLIVFAALRRVLVPTPTGAQVPIGQLARIETRTGPPMIVLVSVPFFLIGAFWILWFLDYNLSVAVWVGMIALAGVAAETGVLMIVYLDEAWARRQQELDEAGHAPGPSDLLGAVVDGAVQRVRPKIMTVTTTILGLLPIMWAPTMGTGTDVTKRIARPPMPRYGVGTNGSVHAEDVLLRLLDLSASRGGYKQRGDQNDSFHALSSLEEPEREYPAGSLFMSSPSDCSSETPGSRRSSRFLSEAH